MTIIKYGLLAAFVAAQGYYWFVYFPRAWKDRSNREIDNIRVFVDYLRERQ